MQTWWVLLIEVFRIQTNNLEIQLMWLVIDSNMCNNIVEDTASDTKCEWQVISDAARRLHAKYTAVEAGKHTHRQ